MNIILIFISLINAIKNILVNIFNSKTDQLQHDVWLWDDNNKQQNKVRV